MKLENLKVPFKNISWRIGSKSKDGTKATFLAYIDARDVMDRLDEVVGANNWKVEYERVQCTQSNLIYIETGKNDKWNKPEKKLDKVIDEQFFIMIAKLSIRINDEWITKCDGAGARDTETEKSSMSDALKRSAVLWGIGRYLYDVRAPYVPIDDWGKPTAEGQKILDKALMQITQGIYKNDITPQHKTEQSNNSNEIFDDLKNKISTCDNKNFFDVIINNIQDAKANNDLSEEQVVILRNLVRDKKIELEDKK